jgi:hypothetical protein
MEDKSEASLAVTSPVEVDGLRNLPLEVRIRGLFTMCAGLSKTFVSNQNISVI